MKRTILAAAALAALTLGVDRVSTAYAADPDTRAALGTVPISANSQKEIEKTLTDVIEQVLDKDVEDTIDNFSKSDRERLGKRSETTPSNLKALVSQLKDSWKAKYGHNFNTRGAEIPYSIVQTDTKGITAVVTVPTNTVVSGLKLNLINEGTVTNSWKIDLPDTTANAQLKANLESAIKDINDSRGTWPADEKEAYRSVALRILGAISGSVA